MSVVQPLILGIDPGLSGALAYFNYQLNEIHSLHDMPIHEIKGKRHLDYYALTRLIKTYSPSTAFAVIEDVSAMPGQGVTSMFRFGQAFGVAQGAVAAAEIPMTFVRPSVWKSAMNLSHDKDDSRRKASHLFPKDIEKWARKKDDGRAEALLLAVFAARNTK